MAPNTGGAPPSPASDVLAAVRSLHASGTGVVLYLAGGGSWAASWLLVPGGGSGTVLEARIPYSRASFRGAVGASAARGLDSFAGAGAARALARAAFQRAVWLAPPGARVVGVGAACALAAGARRGSDRAHVAAFGPGRVAEYALALAPGDRLRQEELTARLVLQALADDARPGTEEAVAVAAASPLALVRGRLQPGDRATGPAVCGASDPVAAVLAHDVGFVEFARARAAPDATCANVLLPGSFNPVHRGHRRLLAAAVRVVQRERGEGVRGAFEMSCANPDKPPLGRDEVARRVAQFTGGDTPVVVSRAALFLEKAKLYPGAVFAVGVDTAARLVMPKYYGGFEKMMDALADIRAQGCSILVAARVDRAGKVLTLRDVDVPPGARGLFCEIPEAEFREDISSTEIRARNT